MAMAIELVQKLGEAELAYEAENRVAPSVCTMNTTTRERLGARLRPKDQKAADVVRRQFSLIALEVDDTLPDEVFEFR